MILSKKKRVKAEWEDRDIHIWIDAVLLKRAKERAREERKTLSKYIRDLIEEDYRKAAFTS